MRRIDNFYVFICCFLAAGIFFGCAAQRKSLLPQRVSGYHDACHWKNFDEAAQYVADPNGFIEKIRKNDSIDITEYEILRITTSPDGREATVGVRRSYTVPPSVSVHTQVLEQKWKFDPKKKDWFLVSPY